MKGKGGKQGEQTKRLLTGKERVNRRYACVPRARRVGGDGRGLPGAVFSPEVPSLFPGPRGHGFLTSFVLAPPRPSTRFGSWLVLPGRSRGSEYVCDGPRAARDRGTPARPPPRPPGYGTSVCSLAGLRFSRRSPTRGRRAVRGPSVRRCPTRLSWPAGVSAFPCRSKAWDRCSKRAGRPWPRWGWPFCLFYLHSPQDSLSFGEAGQFNAEVQPHLDGAWPVRT